MSKKKLKDEGAILKWTIVEESPYILFAFFTFQFVDQIDNNAL